MEQIVKAVATFYDVYYKTLMMPGRSKKKQAIAKQMAFVLIADFLPQLGVHEVGEYFKRDHSTVVAGRKVLREELQVNRHRRVEYEKLYTIVETLDLTKGSMYCRSNTLSISKITTHNI